ncbi:DWNN-domain-containing protein [Apiospora aurea]|uniref:DWNN-domain-containing protein n=1 Tax=Apiospora aurea TaxID=335848 RepID=A0ABR1QI20_9PEZI
MDPGHDSHGPAPIGLDQTSLSQLERMIDVDFGVNGHGQQVLDKYLQWLHQQVVKDMFVREDSLVCAWICSLTSRGFEHNVIYSSFKDWQDVVDQKDPSSRRRYLMVEEEIRKVLEGKHHAPSQLESRIQNSRSQPIDANDQSKPALDVSPPSSPERWTKTGGRKRPGANDTPVTNNKGTRSSNTLGPNSQPTKDLPSTREGGKLRFTQGPPFLSEDEMSSVKLGAPNQRHMNLRNRTIAIRLSPEPSPKESNGSSKPDSSRTKKKQPVNSGTGAKKSKKAHSKPQAYLCKRCHKAGHIVQDCPTNLDPRYDTPPAPDYLCNFCGKVGVHLGTLCPDNRLPWSLTTKRKDAAAKRLARDSENWQDRRERSPVRLSLPIRQCSDSYRPGSSPRARNEVTDRYRPSYRERSLSSPGDTSPSRGARGRSTTPAPLFRSSPFHEAPPVSANLARDTKRGRKRRARDRDGYRSRNNGHRDGRSRSPKPDGSHTMILRKPGTEGRLSYEDEDLFMQNTQAMPFGIDDAYNDIISGFLPQQDASMVSTDARSLDRELDRPAAVRAQDFLHTLGAQMAEHEDEMEVVYASQMDIMLDEGIDATETSDSTLTVDPDGNQYRLLTSPPYSEPAMRLFPGLTVLIVHPRPGRTTAAEMMEGLDNTASDTIGAVVINHGRRLEGSPSTAGSVEWRQPDGFAIIVVFYSNNRELGMICVLPVPTMTKMDST